jgi:YidC/Oxa1 family membrane protein insertase
MKNAMLLIMLALLPLLSGCFGAQGKPLPADQLYSIRDQFEEIDRLGAAALDERLTALRREVDDLSGTKDRARQAELARKRLLVGYHFERRGDFFPDAAGHYEQAARGEYASVALFRTAQMAEYAAALAEADSQDLSLSSEERQRAVEIRDQRRDQAKKALDRASNYPVDTRVTMRDPGVGSIVPGTWHLVDIRHEAYKRLDAYNRTKPLYRGFEFIVQLCGGEERNSSYILAIILIAVLAKLITTPLSAAQFRSMQAMQAVQPEVKKLQEKYKDDKQKLAKEQMELFRKHGVNPAASCLPMLIQMPILIGVYYGIRSFVFRFEGISFLYIEDLASPDVLRIGETLWPGPLLLLYGVSMFFSQKLIATPAATPEQQQQQKMMAIVMPVMLVLILKALPAAFILYWFLQNILMTGHQYLIGRPGRLAAAAAGAGAPSPGPTPEPPAAGPPPEAMEKLSQGPRRRKKKRRR